MAASTKLPSLVAPDLAVRLRRHQLIVQEPAKLPGWAVAFHPARPQEAAVYPVLSKDFRVSGKLADTVRRRLGLEHDKFWPKW